MVTNSSAVFRRKPERREDETHNPNRVWETFCRRFERPVNDPCQIRIRQFSHSLGRSASISCEVEWDPDDYLPSQRFTVED